MISFSITGVNPLPKQSYRARKSGHGYIPKRIKDWQNTIAQHAMVAMAGREPFKGPIALGVSFYRADARKVDNDNLMKAVKDAMNGIVYEDDTQVVFESSMRHVCRDNPGIDVSAYELTDDLYTMEIRRSDDDL